MRPGGRAPGRGEWTSRPTRGAPVAPSSRSAGHGAPPRGGGRRRRTPTWGEWAGGGGGGRGGGGGKVGGVGGSNKLRGGGGGGGGGRAREPKREHRGAGAGINDRGLRRGHDPGHDH